MNQSKKINFTQTTDADIESYLKTLDLSTICRSCLSNDIEMFSLFSNHDSKLTCNVLKFYDQYLQIKIVTGDGMPDQLCASCFKQLSDAFHFKEQCGRIDKILHNHIKSKNINIVVDDTILTVRSEPSINNKNKKLKKHIQNPLNDEITNDNKNRTESVIKSFNKLDTDNVTENETINEDNVDFDEITKKPNESNNSNLKSNDRFCCFLCGDTFSTSHGLLVHSRIHQSESLLCSTCGISFSDTKSLHEHALTHTGDKPFKCSYCTRRFSKKKSLQYHEKTHTGDRPYVCDFCGKSYIQRNNLVIHRRNHTGEKPFVCKECGKAFTNGASLKLHMPIHKAIKDFVCKICGKRLARSGELTIHMRTHTGEKPYVCQVCSKAFIKKSSLRAHTYTHTGEKKYICPTCGHRVAHAGKLTVHMRTHSNNKPCVCSVCDRKFTNSKYLKQHSKIHYGDKSKPFACSECGRGFLKSGNLTEHMRTHTGEKPYKCIVCNLGFGQKSAMNYHVRKAHSDVKLVQTNNDVESVKLSKENKSKKTNVKEIFYTNEIINKYDKDKKYPSKSSDNIVLSTTTTVQTKTNDYVLPVRESVNLVQNISSELKTNCDTQIYYDPVILNFPTFPL